MTKKKHVGWRGEPERHAKAARGIKTKKLTPKEAALRKATQEYLAAPAQEAINDLKWILEGAQSSIATGTPMRLTEANEAVESQIRKAVAALEVENLPKAIEAIETAIEYSFDSVQVEFLDNVKDDLLKSLADMERSRPQFRKLLDF